MTMLSSLRRAMRSKQPKTIDDLIVEAAARHGLNVHIVRAIVSVESSGNPLAMKFEPAWRHFLEYRNPAASQATERNQQATSWGLMQVMGTVAREHGFLGPFLSALCDPETGLDYGCRFLAKQMRRYPGKTWHAVSAYNAGTARVDVSGHYSNQDYVDKVRVALEVEGGILIA